MPGAGGAARCGFAAQLPDLRPATRHVPWGVSLRSVANGRSGAATRRALLGRAGCRQYAGVGKGLAEDRIASSFRQPLMPEDTNANPVTVAVLAGALLVISGRNGQADPPRPSSPSGRYSPGRATPPLQPVGPAHRRPAGGASAAAAAGQPTPVCRQKPRGREVIWVDAILLLLVVVGVFVAAYLDRSR